MCSCCCFGTPNTGLRPFETIPPFHGEIAIDAATGAVYRLVLITELSPSDPIFQERDRHHGDYTDRSSGMLGCAVGVTDDCSPIEVARPKDTAINDTEYDSYHVFGSEMRILATGTTNQEDKSLSNSAAPVLSVAPGP